MRNVCLVCALAAMAVVWTGCGAQSPGSTIIEIKGKVAAAQSKNRRGEEITVAAIAVVEAKAADGKSRDDLKGKTLLTNRRDGEQLLKYAGKEITVTGALDPSANNLFRLDAVKERDATPASVTTK